MTMFKFDPFEMKRWELQANEFMFHLMNTKSSGFCGDDFYELARNEGLPASVIKNLSAKLFREYQAAGYIQKTDKYRLSRRNGSTPLPIWVKYLPKAEVSEPQNEVK